MERDYILIGDDTCDMPPEFYEEHQIPLLYIRFHLEGRDCRSIDIPPKEFYDYIRAGKMPTTSQPGVDEICGLFEPYLQQGKDILYLGFSSGLSGTVNTAAIMARELEEKYPGRRVRVLDSLCASMGEGLLLYKMILKRDEGATLDELYDYGEELRHRVSHYVAAEDLMHYHRGGRISKTSAVVGGVLGIKPMIHMDEKGNLVNIGKVRGRKQSLEAVVDMTEKVVGDTPNDIFFVNHSDSYEDALFVAELAKKRFGIDNYIINYIGPVIGSHTGTGTVSLFMIAKGK